MATASITSWYTTITTPTKNAISRSIPIKIPGPTRHQPTPGCRREIIPGRGRPTRSRSDRSNRVSGLSAVISVRNSLPGIPGSLHNRHSRPNLPNLRTAVITPSGTFSRPGSDLPTAQVLRSVRLRRLCLISRPSLRTAATPSGIC